MDTKIFYDVATLLGDIIKCITNEGAVSVDILLKDLPEQSAPKEIRERLFRNDCDCDDAIRKFVSGVFDGRQNLNSLSSKEKYALVDRCVCALDWIGSFLNPQLPISLPPEYSREKLFYWVLVDLWIERKDLWMKVTAQSVCDEYFYGESYL